MISKDNTIVLIPAYNEAENIADLLEEVRLSLPGMPICVVNDCSRDGTVAELLKAQCHFLDLSCNLGVGGAMQTGFRYAYEKGYDYVIRLDGDGQHPPGEAVKLIERMRVGDVDMVTGSRFLGSKEYISTWYRQIGIFGLAWLLSKACRKRITDPTSGFQMMNRSVLAYFAHQYPVDYPEPEALAFLSRQGYRYCEVGVTFRPRKAGKSSITNWGTLYYLFKVIVALLVDRCRAVDVRYDRQHIEAWL